MTDNFALSGHLLILLIVAFSIVFLLCLCLIIVFYCYYTRHQQLQHQTQTQAANHSSNNDQQDDTKDNNVSLSPHMTVFETNEQKNLEELLANPLSDSNSTHADSKDLNTRSSNMPFTTSSKSNTGSSLLSSDPHKHSGHKNPILKRKRTTKEQHEAIQQFTNPKLKNIPHGEIQFSAMIGRGKFGRVFLAEWGQRTVAVKWFRQDEIEEDGFDDFKSELVVASKLPDHPNVLHIFGYTINPYALIVEYLNSGSVEMACALRNASNRRASLRLSDIVQIFLDAAAGISHLHNAQIIHRDVAARNLMLDKVGDDPLRVVVCDFGLSRITKHVENGNYTTSHVGPLKWMSPESIKMQSYNTKTDVFSFGVTMWEILAGIPPYPELPVVHLAVKVLYENIRPKVLSWFPVPLSLLMQRCWQTLPAYRPTFEQVIFELRSYHKMLLKTPAEDGLMHNVSEEQMGGSFAQLSDLSRLIESCEQSNRVVIVEEQGAPQDDAKHQPYFTAIRHNPWLKHHYFDVVKPHMHRGMESHRKNKDEIRRRQEILENTKETMEIEKKLDTMNKDMHGLYDDAALHKAQPGLTSLDVSESLKGNSQRASTILISVDEMKPVYGAPGKERKDEEADPAMDKNNSIVVMTRDELSQPNPTMYAVGQSIELKPTDVQKINFDNRNSISAGAHGHLFQFNSVKVSNSNSSKSKSKHSSKEEEEEQEPLV